MNHGDWTLFEILHVNKLTSYCIF